MKLEELDYKYTTYSVSITRSTNSDHIKKTSGLNGMWICRTRTK